MRRIIWRTIRRLAGHTELWNGNMERWRNLFTWDEQGSVISWVWQHYPIYRQRYTAAARDPRYALYRFKTVARCLTWGFMGSATRPASIRLSRRRVPSAAELAG